MGKEKQLNIWRKSRNFVHFKMFNDDDLFHSDIKPNPNGGIVMTYYYLFSTV